MKTKRIITLILLVIIAAMVLSSCEEVDQLKAKRINWSNDDYTEFVYNGETYVSDDSVQNIVSNYYLIRNSNEFYICDEEVPLLLIPNSSVEFEYDSVCDIFKGYNVLNYSEIRYYVNKKDIEKIKSTNVDSELNNLCYIRYLAPLNGVSAKNEYVALRKSESEKIFSILEDENAEKHKIDKFVYSNSYYHDEIELYYCDSNLVNTKPEFINVCLVYSYEAISSNYIFVKKSNEPLDYYRQVTGDVAETIIKSFNESKYYYYYD